MHEVRTSRDDGYIEVRHWADVTEQDAVEARNAVEKVMQRSGIQEVLVDLREAIWGLDTVEIFEFASEFDSRMRIAMLIKENDSKREDFEFLETVAVNRGNDFSIHTCRDAALHWLRPTDSTTGDTITAF